MTAWLASPLLKAAGASARSESDKDIVTVIAFDDSGKKIGKHAGEESPQER